jgi:CRISPR-associated protein Cas5d
MPISILVTGDYACFTRPELSVERYTYDAITPSAAVGLVEQIYWKPAIRWVIERIHVLNPIYYTNITRNEVGTAGPYHGRISTTASRMQRSSVVLRDVAYVVELHGDETGCGDEQDRDQGINIVTKHETCLRRRLERGQRFAQPYLGCREWSARVRLIDEAPRSANVGERDLGLMLHTLDRSNGRRWFWRAVMRDGVIEVPPFSGPGVYEGRRAAA